jgi:hypothetical protein
MTTPRLLLPVMSASTSQKHVTFNEAMYRLEMTGQSSVINVTTTAPPVSPSEGDLYVVATGATGDWSGRDGQIAGYLGGQWYYSVPGEGWLIYDKNTTVHLKYNGTAWVNAFSASGGAFGWQNFQDVTTQSSPVALTAASTWYDLTNDAAGALTTSAFAASDHGVIWDDATDTFDFTDLSVGDVVKIRTDIEFVTGGANHACELRMAFGPSYVYSLPIHRVNFKTAVSGGDGQVLRYFSFAMLNTDTRNNPAKLQARSDATGDTVKVNGWLVETHVV